MQRLIGELRRLYLPDDSLALEALQSNVTGVATMPVRLWTADGHTRTLVIAFDRQSSGDQAQHWDHLCLVANALQVELGLPAPAVSISGADGFRLWLSFASPMPVASIEQFWGLLRKAYFPDMPLSPDPLAPIELPPCLHQPTGRWAAFINPGLGASFADEAGLEMAPPFGGQSALLEGLQSITEAQFQHALHTLQPVAEPVPAPSKRTAAPGLLLKDATLEEIVMHLHSLNIEPTFRHLIGKK